MPRTKTAVAYPRTITMVKSIDEVVRAEEHGGVASSGTCMACHASGWLEGIGHKGARYGYPAGTGKKDSVLLTHREGCPMNAILNADGSVRPAEVQVCCGGTRPCINPVRWIRHTQFTGDHPFCDAHAKQEDDFGENSSYKDWEDLKKKKKKPRKKA